MPDCNKPSAHESKEDISPLSLRFIKNYILRRKYPIDPESRRLYEEAYNIPVTPMWSVISDGIGSIKDTISQLVRDWQREYDNEEGITWDERIRRIDANINLREKEDQQKDIKEAQFLEYLKGIFSDTPDLEGADYDSFLNEVGASHELKASLEDYLTLFQDKKEEKECPRSPEIGNYLWFSNNDLEWISEKIWRTVNRNDSGRVFQSFQDILHIFWEANIEVSSEVPSEWDWICVSSHNDMQKIPGSNFRNIGYYIWKNSDGYSWVLENDIGSEVWYSFTPLEIKFLQSPGSKYKLNPHYLFFRVKEKKVAHEIPTFRWRLSERLDEMRNSWLKVDENLYSAIFQWLLFQEWKSIITDIAALNLITKYIIGEEIEGTKEIAVNILWDIEMDIDFSEWYISTKNTKAQLIVQWQVQDKVKRIKDSSDSLKWKIEELIQDLENDRKYGKVDPNFILWIQTLFTKLKEDIHLESMIEWGTIHIDTTYLQKLYMYGHLLSILKETQQWNHKNPENNSLKYTHLANAMRRISNTLLIIRQKTIDLEKQAGKYLYVNVWSQKAMFDVFEEFFDDKYKKSFSLFDASSKILEYLNSSKANWLKDVHILKKVLNSMEIDFKNLAENVFNFIEKNRAHLSEEDLDLIELPIKSVYNTFFDGNGQLKEWVQVKKWLLAWDVTK